MSKLPDSGSALIGQSRDEYLKCLSRHGVSLRHKPYYVKRTNQFIAAAGGRSLSSLDKNDIDEILMSFGRDKSLSDWQFAQLVDAVRIYLIDCSKNEATIGVDWSYWKNSSRSLRATHASTARE